MIPNTKFMTSLIETLVETGLGLSSAKLYVSKLAMLNDKKGGFQDRVARIDRLTTP